MLTSNLLRNRLKTSNSNNQPLQPTASGARCYRFHTCAAAFQLIDMDRENPVPAVQILQASKSFAGGVTALRELSLEVQQGERVVIIGPSGSGKSTLLRCLAGLEPVDAGRILIEGVPLDEKTRRKIGMVFQSFNLFPHLTVLDNLNLAQRLVQKKSLAEATAASLELLARVNMPDKARSLPGELSGGQQQRVAIARALALKPRIMLFDEVTSALDPEMIGEVLSVIRDLAQAGMTMLVVTHEMAFARELGERVIFMEQGEVIETGDSKSFFARPREARTRDFLSRIL